MNETYILTDGQNLFMRQASMTNPSHGIDSVIGITIHMILLSMRKEFRDHNGSHTIFFLEGKSWRKNVYPDYKANRKLKFAQQTPKEQEDHKILIEAFNDFIEYLDTKTNITVLRNENAEADDLIALFIEAHPDDKHILISSDSDFFQLLKYPNVTLYDPVKDILITQNGIFNDKGERLSFELLSSAKIKAGKPDENFICEDKWYEYALFLKCVRGDATDNIFSAYPGVREKGTKTTVGIREAFGDRNSKGYSWNNFMLQRFEDHNKIEHKVKDRYEENSRLIDLSQIPDNIKQSCLETIVENIDRKDIPANQVGFQFMKFCGKWDLQKIASQADSFMPLLKTKYTKV